MSYGMPSGQDYFQPAPPPPQPIGLFLRPSVFGIFGCLSQTASRSDGLKMLPAADWRSSKQL